MDGVIFRYDTGETKDGLPPDEGAFLACSFWFVDNFILQGRFTEARAMFERLRTLRNDVGLLAEEYDQGEAPDGKLSASLQPRRLGQYRLQSHPFPANERTCRSGGDRWIRNDNGRPTGRHSMIAQS